MICTAEHAHFFSDQKSTLYGVVALEETHAVESFALMEDEETFFASFLQNVRDKAAARITP